MEKHDPAHKFQIVGPFEVTLDSVKDLLVLARQPEAQGACDNAHRFATTWIARNDATHNTE
jgi:hypothetical protein